MSDDALARRRWLALTLVRIAAASGGMLGLVLIGRARTWGPKALGVAILLSALLMLATVPRALAHRWRSPE